MPAMSRAISRGRAADPACPERFSWAFWRYLLTMAKTTPAAAGWTPLHRRKPAGRPVELDAQALQDKGGEHHDRGADTGPKPRCRSMDLFLRGLFERGSCSCF